MRSSPSLRSALLLAVCAVVLVVAGARILGDARESIPAPVSPAAQQPAVRTESPREGLDGPETPASDRRAIAVRFAVRVPDYSRIEAAAPGSPPVGKLVVCAVDAESGASIRAPSVRAVSATRFAAKTNDDSSEDRVLRVAAGEYALHVASAGYEPAELGPVRVAAHETTRLEPVRLVPGSGRIEGRAMGALGDDLVVELHGSGRGRCGSNCTEACVQCGWYRDLSRSATGTTGDFAFDRLASGVYIVRVVDGRGREAATPARVKLGANEARRIEVRIARARTIVIGLDDVDGSPLDRVWSERRARLVPDRVALSTVAALEWTARFLDGEILVTEQTFTPPDPTGMVHRWGSFGIGCPLGVSPIRDDRARLLDDTLRPPVVVPELVAVCPYVDVDHHGLVRCEGVPARTKSVELRCEPFRATTSLRVPSSAVFRARLVRDPEGGEHVATYAEFEHAHYD